MASTIKPMGAVNSIAAGTTSAMGNATNVYVYNNSAGIAIIFRLEANAVSNSVLGSFQMANTTGVVIQKEHTERVSSNATIAWTAVGDTN